MGSILDAQSRVNRLQKQIASGSRLSSAADDPVAAARSADLDRSIQQLGQFMRNADQAGMQLSRAEGVLAEMTGVLQRVRELAVQSNNATQSPETRSHLAVEVRALLEEAAALANSRDADGRYLFSGHDNRVIPFTPGADGRYSYNGDSGTRDIQIGNGHLVRVGDPGNSLFAGRLQGNGSLLITTATTNPTSVLTANGEENPPGAYNGHSLRVQFTAPDRYDVIDDTDNVTLASAVAFATGDTLQVGGVRLRVQGTPVAGDSLQIVPAATVDIFDTVADLAGLLDGTLQGTHSGQFQDRIGRILQELDLIDTHLVQSRADIGTRLSMLESQRDMNAAQTLQIQETLSSLRDIDYTAATGDLSLQLAVLQAAQQTFLRIQNLSLLDYLD